MGRPMGRPNQNPKFHLAHWSVGRCIGPMARPWVSTTNIQSLEQFTILPVGRSAGLLVDQPMGRHNLCAL